MQYDLRPYKKRRDIETQTQEEGQVMPEAETGVMRLQAEGREGLPAIPETWRKAQNRSSLQPSGKAGPVVQR